MPSDPLDDLIIGAWIVLHRNGGILDRLPLLLDEMFNQVPTHGLRPSFADITHAVRRLNEQGRLGTDREKNDEWLRMHKQTRGKHG